MKAVIKAVSKYKGLLINGDDKWWNATKEAAASLPDNMAQFVGREVELSIVQGKSHAYSGFTLLTEDSLAEEGGRPNSSHTGLVLTRDERVSRMACLDSAIVLVGLTKKMEGRPIEECKAVVLTMAEELLGWVNKNG